MLARWAGDAGLEALGQALLYLQLAARQAVAMPPFNFLDLDLFQRDTPHAELTHLRRTAPVYWHPMPTPREPQGGFWLLTRYDDVTQTAKNTKVFASSSGTTLTDAPPPT